MDLILVSDIFGRTPEFEALAEEVAPLANRIALVDPYGDGTVFESEPDAYAWFQAHVGLDRYLDRVAEAAARTGPGTAVIGFSVGASAVWRFSGTGDAAAAASRAICFYGSQIRHYLYVTPVIPVWVVAACHEPGGDIRKVLAAVSAKPGVVCRRTPYGHGFMNRRSDHFDENGYRECLVRLSELLRQDDYVASGEWCGNDPGGRLFGG